GLASPRLSLLLEQDKQQLGRAFSARLMASGIDKNLSAIDLSPLEKNFGVIVKEYSGTTGNANTVSEQQLAIELYPRDTGLLEVPELFFSATSSSALEVEVLQAQSPSGPINVEYQISTAQPWQRQQVLLNINVTTPDRFARLETVDMQHADNDILSILASKEILADTTRLRTGWVIFPTQSGQQKISLPPVLYHLQGIVERRFYLPTIQLNVKPLPGYIPPLMPVGKVFIDSHIDANQLLSTKETYNWNIRLSSPELLSRLLPPILRQISSDDNIHFLPVQSRRAENITAHGSHGEVVHTVPFQALSTGRVKLPELRIQYFDPVQGRVAVTEYSPPQTWGMASYWLLLIGTGFLLASIFLVKLVWKYWLCLRRRREYMRKAIQLIANATNGEHLRQALHLIAKAERWPANLSITKWNEHWNSCYSPSATLTMNNLSRACYAQSKTDAIQIRADLLKLIENRKPGHCRFFVICS
ncbi:MAG: hypothetical protein HKM22_00020, partial [Gammaproteobacteria bacterium]|nr:hypothetical protein [Gammaproteobacteria bacterium]